MIVCLLQQQWSPGVCVSPVRLSYLSSGPRRALTHIGHTEAETVGAAKWMTALQVVETRFTQITVGSHYVRLRRQGRPRCQNSRDVREQQSPQTTGETSEKVVHQRTAEMSK